MKKASAAGLQRDIGTVVVRVRQQRGLTQQKLARAMGTRQANISRIERGLQNLSLEFLKRLASVLRLKLKISMR